MLTKNDIHLLKRLLGYEKRNILIGSFILSLLGFVLAAGGKMGMANVAVMLEKGWYDPESTMWLIPIQLYIFVPLYIFLVALVQGVGHVFGSYFLSRVARKIIQKIRAQLMKNLLRKKQSFYDQQSSDSLSSILIYHVEQIYSCIAGGIITALKESLTVVFLFGYLLYLNSTFTLLMLFVIPVAILIIRFISKRFYTLSKRIQLSIESFGKDSIEMLRAIQLIRLYSSVDFQSRKFEQSNINNYQQNMKLILTQLLSSPILEMLVAVLMAGMVWLILSNRLPNQFDSLASFISYILAVGLIGQPIKKLSLVIGVIQKGIVAVERVFHYLDTPGEDIDRGKSVTQVKGRITLKAVDMEYPNGTHALHDINLVIEPGQMMALVGRSGSGKTTLAHLLLRFYTPTNGAVFLDDWDMKSLSLRCLRAQFALVSQNQIFLNDSITNNIAYATDDIDTKKLQTAADMAHVTEFANKLEQGFDANIGDNGSRLSGGQRQRVAIARALYRDAPILVLDEATSALDNQSDERVQSALRNLTNNKTTLVIAHKLSNIIHADTILVLDGGRVMQQGTHQELIATSGIYRDMYQQESQKI